MKPVWRGSGELRTGHVDRAAPGGARPPWERAFKKLATDSMIAKMHPHPRARTHAGHQEATSPIDRTRETVFTVFLGWRVDRPEIAMTSSRSRVTAALLAVLACLVALDYVVPVEDGFKPNLKRAQARPSTLPALRRYGSARAGALALHLRGTVT